MTDWTDGYRVDIDYTHGYYAELNPLHMQFAMLLAGLTPPEVDTACELGFGQGVSLNIHAAASGVAWYGTDFNPAQTAFAQELAQASGTKARCYNDAFIEFAERSDLPEFDFIALHGIWSWVSEENQRAILRLIDRRLRVGGVVYVGYNAMPGWAPVLPLRELLVRHIDTMTATGSEIGARVSDARAFLDRLFKTNPAALRANLTLSERLSSLAGHDPRYLVHEYLNENWKPQSILEMAEQLGTARLRFACSARWLDAVDAINLTSEQARILQEVADPVTREMLRDFIINRFFRRDYWVKGARSLTPHDRAERLRAMRVILLRDPADIDLKVKGALGEADLLPAIYAPVLDALADRVPLTLGEIDDAVRERDVSFALMLEALTVLMGRGLVSLVQPDARANAAADQCAALNQYLMSRAETSGDVSVLASPLTGGGITVGRFQQMFLAECHKGGGETAQLAATVWKVLREQGQVLLKDGKPIEGEEANLEELSRLAGEFMARDHGMLHKVWII